MPKPWVDLATAYGGVGRLAEHIGISPMHLNRLATGKTSQVRKPIHESVVRAAVNKGLPSPFDAVEAVEEVELPSETVMTILDQLGGSQLVERRAVPPKALERVRQLVTEEQLIALTEQAERRPGSIADNIVKACMFLLEAD